ncbi:efflux RND transporter permease subunit [Legionella maioricensis]|uniref:CusA/CzcA family heavy metal efflux RND transporter n=1 Tax=Legionella maioricensis TaxID=2896528 RepID=A0A9X2CYX6_9GAMM|nr:CusA/CzcA family heavy metal efflux RND transporter [Legionella maioricensis]MCL9682857.1 CusA/CzcA family heavy metal efflux RND transporter [Legionella maioricensis]MCL9686515.1 CusA/CzcA family heavy metal efflux RND transporter [Legionella maioricensis]
MIAAIIRWSIQNRPFILLATLLLILSGLYILKQTPLDAIPDLSDVQVIIKSFYPGQAPQIVEDQVTYPLTTKMIAVPGAVTVRGQSAFDDSYIYLIFKDGTDLYWARSRVLEYLSQVANRLPPNASTALGPDATGVGWVYEYALVDTTGKHDLSQLTTLQDWYLKFQLQKVPGVSEVARIGGMVRRYEVILDPSKLRAFDLTLSQVIAAIRDANQEAGGSTIEMGEADYMIRARGYLKKTTDFENIPLGVSKQGTPILLSDVASMRLGPENRRGIAELNGKGEVVGGVIIMRFGENAMKTIQEVKAKLAELKDSLPPGVNIVETYDRSSLIQRAVNTLNDKLIEEFVLVSLICFAFLFHLRSALVIVITLPIGILASFIIMYWQGITANIMSLGGIAIAIGVMVDAAIVMIENVHKHFEQTVVTKENRWQIIQEATLQVGPSLFFSLLIIMFSFLPIFTLQAEEGRLFSPLAFTKTYAMACAAALSITLVPVLMGYLIRGRIRPETENPLNRALQAVYQPVIHAVLKAPKTILAIAFVLVLIGFWPVTRLGSEFMPPLNEGDLLYMPTTFPAISVGKAQQLIQQIDKLILTVPEVKSAFGKIGHAETATDPASMSMIETTIQFKPQSEWRPGMTFEKIRDELDQHVQIPGVTNVWVMPIRNRIDMLATGIKTPLGIKIIGPDLKVIQEIGEKIEQVLKPLPGTASVFAERVVSARYVNVDIDRLKASRYALNIRGVQEMIENAVGGMNITQTVEGLERYPVNLRYPQFVRDSVAQLRQLPIVTPTGAHIPLEAVATLSVTDGPDMIKTENTRPAGWVYVDIAGRDLGSYTKAAQQAVKQNISLPPGYSLLWSGQYQYMERAEARLMIVIPLTLLIIIVLLYLNFHRFSEVFIILGTLPLALVGGVWFIYLLGYYLSIAVGVGFIALAGVSAETGVIMLIYLDQALLKQQQLAQQEGRALTKANVRSAVIEGALLRLRPKMMTVLAIIGGLLPIMIGGGTGSEVMRRIAAPMVGGMITATLLTLIVIPAVFLVWQESKITEIKESGE